MKYNTQLEVSTRIKATIDQVWEALTNPQIIKKYFFGTNTITDWQPGNPIRFKGEWQGKTYEDKGTILEMKERKLISYSYWSSMSGIEDIPENYVIVTYMVGGKDGDVEVTVRQQNIPDEKMKAHSEENWKRVLQDLKSMLEEKERLVPVNTLDKAE
jgi:uncharacterized protein YndB with AHSA1/START domain